MRIAYVSLHWPRTHHGGVGKKIARQISAWRAHGHEIRFFMHMSEYEPRHDLIEGEKFPYAVRGKMRREWERIGAAARLVRAVEAFQPDLIHLRYGMYVYPIHDLTRIAPVVEDVTTNDLIQHQELGRWYALYNRLTRGILLRRVEGLVAISHELARSSAFAPYQKRTFVIGNGIDLENFKPFPPPCNTTPRLVFMGSPSAGFAAHGVDKLVTLAGLCPDLHFDVIGYDGFRGHGTLHGNIAFHGYLPSERYLPLLHAADAAISSLAFHRVGMQEQSPLKSREYLACGLPMVVPYIDTDLDDLDCDFLLKIPNQEDNVRTHAAAIHDFAYRMRGRRADRELIMSRIDSGPKEIARLSFFAEILEQSHHSNPDFRNN